MTKRQDPITKSMIIWLINSVLGKDHDCKRTPSSIFLSWESKLGGGGSSGHNQKIQQNMDYMNTM